MSRQERSAHGFREMLGRARSAGAPQNLSDGGEMNPDPPSPPKQPKRMRSTNVLDVDVLIWLDQESTEIKRRTGGKSVRRSEMMRGILAAVRDAGVDIGRYQSEDEIREALVELLLAGVGRKGKKAAKP